MKSTRLAKWHWMNSTLVFVLLCSCALTAQEPQGDAKGLGFSPEKLKRINEVLQSSVDKGQVKGATMLLARQGKIVQVASAGKQDAEADVPMSDTTIFRIASMSKPITSVAIMKLVEDGKLSVTDPLSKFVPEFKDMKVLVPAADGKSYDLVPAKREITIHHLLTHTSGITYRLINKPFVCKMYADAGVCDGLVEVQGSLADNVRKIAKLPLVCQPGEAWEYGLNTDVLGHVIEVVTGQSLEQFCQEAIFQPLKMTDTTFALPKEKSSRLSSLYAAGGEGKMTRVGAEPKKTDQLEYSATYPLRREGQYCSGGAGLVSTLRDYFRFCQMMLNRGELDGVRVLKPETVALMTQNQLGSLPLPFPGAGSGGYGFGILTEKSKEQSKDPAGVGTYSWGGAFNTYFWVDPRNELIGIYMSQIYPPNFISGQEIKRLTYEALLDPKN